jgi:hypothetical protein
MLRTSLALVAVTAALAAAAMLRPAAAGDCCACVGGCGIYAPVPPLWSVLPPPTPVPFYIVNQGPDYSGNFITTLPTIDAEGPPVDYPYVGPRVHRLYGPGPYRRTYARSSYRCRCHRLP